MKSVYDIGGMPDIKERAQVVRDYVATQPKRMKEAFASLVFDTLVQKWPCSPK